MARPKKEDNGEVKGRALVDIPAVDAKCGDFISLPADLAAQFEQSGDFDPKSAEE